MLSGCVQIKLTFHLIRKNRCCWEERPLHISGERIRGSKISEINQSAETLLHFLSINIQQFNWPPSVESSRLLHVSSRIESCMSHSSHQSDTQRWKQEKIRASNGASRRRVQKNEIRRHVDVVFQKRVQQKKQDLSVAVILNEQIKAINATAGNKTKKSMFSWTNLIDCCGFDQLASSHVAALHMHKLVTSVQGMAQWSAYL